MAKYFGSPWGAIRGKVNGLVGMAWKGILTTRALVYPTQRGTLQNYRDMKGGIIPPEQFSFPQFNLRRCITQILIKICSDNMTGWIYPVWSPLTVSKGLKMSGMNLFVKRNDANLFASMDRTLEYDPVTNTPDLKVLQMSEGELEPTQEITTAEYNTATGILNLAWDITCYGNGLPTDKTYCIIAKKPLLDSYGEFGNWQAALTLFNIGEIGVRGEPFMPIPITLPPGLDAADLTVYLFFFAVIENKNTWSPSLSIQVTTPP